LPSMVVCVHKPWADYFVGAIDDMCISRSFNVLSDLHNLAVLNQDTGPCGGDMGICSMYEGNAILEKDSCRSHDKRGGDWEVGRGTLSFYVLILQTVSSII
jgi:hypothetical protein